MRLGVLISGMALLALFAMCEVGLGYPVAGWLYLLVVLAIGGALLEAGRTGEMLLRCAVFAVVLTAASTLHLVDWSTRKPFLRDLARVRPGMTEAEARSIMGRYMEGTGWPKIPGNTPEAAGVVRIAGSPAAYAANSSSAGEMTLADCLVFRHSNDPAYNSDWGIISLRSGKVVRVEFSAD